MELSPLAKKKLKTSLKVAKKLEKMERMTSDPTTTTSGGDNNNDSTTSSELTSLEYNNNNDLLNESSSVDSRIQQIDNLEAIISNIITSGNGAKNCDEHSFHNKKNVGVQTASTGDVVVMKIFEDENQS